MIAYALNAVRQSSNRVSDIGLIAAFSLGGLALSLAFAHFGIDVSAGI